MIIDYDDCIRVSLFFDHPPTEALKAKLDYILDLLIEFEDDYHTEVTNEDSI